MSVTSAAQPGAGIVPHVVDPDLKMQMRTCGVARRSFVGDHCAAGDDLAAVQATRERCGVPIQGRVSVPVDDDDVVAVSVVAGVQVDDSGVRGDDRCAPWSRDVDTCVDPVRVRTVGVVLLEPVAVAPETLADAAMAAGGL